jgi:hypothetical protein
MSAVSWPVSLDAIDIAGFFILSRQRVAESLPIIRNGVVRMLQLFVWYCLTSHQLNNSMEHSSSSEAGSPPVEKLPHSRSPKDHYPVKKTTSDFWCPEPHESISRPPPSLCLLNIQWMIIYLHLVLPNGLFPSGFLIKIMQWMIIYLHLVLPSGLFPSGFPVKNIQWMIIYT